jgi:hypothetical protein
LLIKVPEALLSKHKAIVFISLGLLLASGSGVLGALVIGLRTC